MAVPSFANTTFAAIAGEYADVGGPSIIDPNNYDLTLFPDSVLNIDPNAKPPTLPAGQITMLKTILTQDGRSELFKNPFQNDIDNAVTKLSNLSGQPGWSNTAASMIESLVYFKDHTDRLSGVVEPEANVAALPTLEKALSVGSSLNRYSQILDGSTTNLPALTMFGGFFAGKDLLAKLTTELAKPTSEISIGGINNLATSLAGSVADDINGYFAGIKKLKRIGVVNMVYGGANNQVEKYLVTQMGTDLTKQSVLEVQTPRIKGTPANNTPLTTGTTPGTGSLLVNYRFTKPGQFFGTGNGNDPRIRIIANGIDRKVFEFDIPSPFVRTILSLSRDGSVGPAIAWKMYVSDTPAGPPLGGTYIENYNGATLPYYGGSLQFVTYDRTNAFGATSICKLSTNKKYYLIVTCTGRMDNEPDSFGLCQVNRNLYSDKW